MSEVAWAGGLFEGEGCFTIWKQKTGEASVRQYPRASLATTDRDVADRFRAAMGFGKVHGPYQPSKPKNAKPYYEWKAQGVEGFMKTGELLWDYLGIRRRGRWMEIKEIYEQQYVDTPRFSTRSQNASWMASRQRLRG